MHKDLLKGKALIDQFALENGHVVGSTEQNILVIGDQDENIGAVMLGCRQNAY